jgi:hypothetical protein
MGQILHRSATTTEAIRRAIQHSQESLRTLSRRHGINPKTVANWRKRSSTAGRTGITPLVRQADCTGGNKPFAWNLLRSPQDSPLTRVRR